MVSSLYGESSFTCSSVSAAAAAVFSVLCGGHDGDDGDDGDDVDAFLFSVELITSLNFLVGFLIG